ncbi:MAG: cytochrome C oxidase subunit IV family protein [Mycolicibacterium neoaurum]|uniref:cytochrome C oxidase subunit IV family protein n=1 Tax=Mycolicibacterium neoaurum TaxID=1795 RepID=UPI002FF45AAC
MSEARRLDYVWALLIAITVGSWWLGHAPTAPGQSGQATITIAALVIAALKVGLIVWNFMEARVGPLWLRSSTAMWLVAVLALLLIIYLW